MDMTAVQRYIEQIGTDRLPAYKMTRDGQDCWLWLFYLHKDQIMGANARHTHWSQRSGPTETLRSLGAAHYRLRKVPHFQRLDLHVWVSYPDRVSRDCMNLYPTMKAYVDGLVNGANPHSPERLPNKGMLPDDSDLYLNGPYLRWSGEKSDRRDHYQFTVAAFPQPDMPLNKDAVAPKLYAKEINRRVKAAEEKIRSGN